ncbi:MAG: trypsin-like peptidase domain-containing protein, partial [Candidatus Dormibacteraeota bacterium]|nr:trypsin-like peptidase domain-containing protein [Candidatus Dormibacteraeota bacterium]
MAAACSSTSPATSPSGATRPTPTTAPDSNTGGIASLQGAYVAVVKKVLPSVVQIETSSGLGSGIVYDSKGDIVTNNHVVSGATSFTVTTSSAKKYQGTLVGTFPADDLAVIHVSNASLTPASFADSSKLEVGDIVMAIG